MSNNIPPPPPLDGESAKPREILYSAAQQESDIPQGWKPTVAKPLPAIRCQFIKKDGNRCIKWGVPGTGGWCVKHGAALPAMRKAAAARVEEARTMMMGKTPEMFEVLYSLTKPGVSEGVRLKAVTEILDRAGLKAGQEVNITVEHVGSPLDDIMNQLEIIAGNKDPILDPEEIFDAEEIDEA
jgi:hypothetical protein